ncbi:hypothetical protein PR048_021646 [Dryococelus australis]|uniref:Uncharacterized protein n=1 Tax=Dryococelus australis TaxID=614101 RepID=A0ABQ9GYW6_9NEOP|nr:hypothetical protein PR048_021646 [Dryococelus australis]
MQLQSVKQEHSQDLQGNVGNSGKNPPRQDYFARKEHLDPRVPAMFSTPPEGNWFNRLQDFPASKNSKKYLMRQRSGVIGPSKLPVPPTNTMEDHTFAQQLRE